MTININDKYKIKVKKKFKTNLQIIKEECVLTSYINKYFLKESIYTKSGFGDISNIIDNNENEYIIKIQKEKIKRKNYILKEYKIYCELEGCGYISEYYDYFEYQQLRCLVLMKFDIDLKKLFYKDRIFYLRKRMNFYVTIFEILEDMHNRKIIHGDIKFSNIMYNYKEDKIYLIDFGCSRKWDNKLTERRISGTLRYASLNAHIGDSVNNHNDIESLLYSMLEIEIYPEKLIWKGYYKKYDTTMKKWSRIYRLKKLFLLHNYNKPRSMINLFKYYALREENEEKVNYNEYIKMIVRDMNKMY
jgi:casein kinase 1 alpha|tara:strand:+ start:1055 stop:1963 length:909 start_codon:yes stop_codon:yes gene_type:complete